MNGLPPRPSPGQQFTSGPRLAERFAMIDQVNTMDQFNSQHMNVMNNPPQLIYGQQQSDYLSDQIAKFQYNPGPTAGAQIDQQQRGPNNFTDMSAAATGSEYSQQAQNRQRSPQSSAGILRQQSQQSIDPRAGSQPPSHGGQPPTHGHGRRQVSSRGLLQNSSSGVNLGLVRQDSRSDVRSSIQAAGANYFKPMEQPSPQQNYPISQRIDQQRNFAPVHNQQVTPSYRHQGGVAQHHNSQNVDYLLKNQTPQSAPPAFGYQARLNRALDNKRTARHNLQNRKYGLRQVLQLEI